MNAIKPRDARRFVGDLETRGLAPSTIKGIVLTTNQVFTQAVDDEMIAKSPFTKIIKDGLPGDQSAGEMYFLTASQVDALADAIDDRFRTAVYLGAYGGMRAGEMWALRSERVDVENRTIRIAESASEAGGWHVGPTKTGKPRTITLPGFLAGMLATHIEQYASGFVFTAPHGGPVLHHNFKGRHYTTACISAGLGAKVNQEHDRRARYQGVRFHDLRHTCAAFLLDLGRNLHEIKEYLGHSSIRVTSDRYGHLFPGTRAAMADALDSMFLRAESRAPGGTVADQFADRSARQRASSARRGR
jgi:integrase